MLELDDLSGLAGVSEETVRELLDLYSRGEWCGQPEVLEEIEAIERGVAEAAGIIRSVRSLRGESCVHVYGNVVFL